MATSKSKSRAEKHKNEAHAPAPAEALEAAALAGDAPLVRKLLSQHGDALARTQSQGRGGSWPLSMAARGGSAECVMALLGAGADPLAKSKSGYTALMIAASYGGVAAAKALAPVSDGSAVLEPSGHTALAMAAMLGHAAIVEILANFCDVDARDRFGRTALMSAYANERLECARSIANAGGDDAARDHQGDDAYAIARRRMSPRVAAELEAIALARQSPESSANPDPHRRHRL